ncbi:MAG: hypothetical protein AAGA46_16935 [Cyanobacteria bacterium P01_F01_bin.13]
MTSHDLQDRLKQLIDRWRETSAIGPKAKLLQQILSTMEQSGKIWRAPGVSRDLYEEALQENWLWFTTKLTRYDSDKASVMHWFNQYLKWKISDLIDKQIREEKRRWKPAPNEDGRLPTVEDLSHEHTAAVAVGFKVNLNRMKACVSHHHHQLRRRSMRGRADVSCDRIMAALLERVEQSAASEDLSDIFAQLAADWHLERDSFRRFCSSSCFKLLRQLCQPG